MQLSIIIIYQLTPSKVGILQDFFRYCPYCPGGLKGPKKENQVPKKRRQNIHLVPKQFDRYRLMLNSFQFTYYLLPTTLEWRHWSAQSAKHDQQSFEFPSVDEQQLCANQDSCRSVCSSENQTKVSRCVILGQI